MRFLVHAPLNGTAPPMGAALTPSLTKTYAGWSSRGQIFGQPGTMAIPMPNAVAVRETDLTAMASIGTTTNPRTPDVIFPPLYWEANDPKEKCPVSINSDNQMPVPAGRPASLVLAAPYKARHGGQRQVVQPQVVQTWKGMFSR